MTEKIWFLFLMLRYHFILTWREWRKEIWVRDLDDLYCCTALDFYGQQSCGCQAVTVREWYGYVKEKP